MSAFPTPSREVQQQTGRGIFCWSLCQLVSIADSQIVVRPWLRSVGKGNFARGAIFSAPVSIRTSVQRRRVLPLRSPIRPEVMEHQPAIIDALDRVFGEIQDGSNVHSTNSISAVVSSIILPSATNAMRHERSIVLYAVGSPMIADVEESCRRLGVTIAAAVKNVAGPHYLLDASVLLDADQIEPALLRFPCIIPLLTPASRRSAAQEAVARGFTIAPAVVDPTAIVASSAEIDAGSYVNAGVVIGASARIGLHVIVNRSASIGHHAELASMVSIGPAAVVAGQARVGQGTLVGAGAIILPQIEVGPGCVIGAGAVVLEDVPAGSLAVGNPAKIVRADLPGIDRGDPYC